MTSPLCMSVQELDCNNKEPIPVFIVGNKVDLDTQRVITTQMGKKVLTAPCFVPK